MKKFFLFMALCCMTVFSAKAADVDLSILEGDEFIAQNGDYLYGTLANNVKISIAEDAMVVLGNVKINAENNLSAYCAGISCKGNATIVLSGSNVIRGLGDYYPGIYVPIGATLTIQTGMETGWLEVSGANLAAAIGGGYNYSGGNIVINGGNITATGGSFAAAIGSGSESSCGSITINGGTIIAEGGQSGAAIGTGYRGTCSVISILGGDITANGGSFSAAIGSGEEGTCVNIEIKNLVHIIATGSFYAAAIGCGYNGKCNDITIQSVGDGSITATAGYNAPFSVGPAMNGVVDHCGKLTIDEVEQEDYIRESPWIYNAPQAIESVQHSEVSGQKVLQNGHLMILRGGKIYTVTGQVVK